MAIALALELLRLTGPDGQHIELNPQAIVSIRAPRASDHFAPGTKCLIFTDGKFLSVKETCEEIVKKLEAFK